MDHGGGSVYLIYLGWQVRWIWLGMSRKELYSLAHFLVSMLHQLFLIHPSLWIDGISPLTSWSFPPSSSSLASLAWVALAELMDKQRQCGPFTVYFTLNSSPFLSPSLWGMASSSENRDILRVDTEETTAMRSCKYSRIPVRHWCSLSGYGLTFLSVYGLKCIPIMKHEENGNVEIRWLKVGSLESCLC